MSSGDRRPEDSNTLRQPIPAGWSIVDLGLLGAGGMARVYRVRDEALGREVALKVLRPELLERDEAVDRFVEEARITAQLDHPNIPHVYALAADRTRSTCFTMKVLGGQSLQKILEENEREEADGLMAALDVLVRICDAVAFAHSRGVLHLDLKPSNVMVDEYGQIYVVDWGIARRMKELPTQHTDDGGQYGTPAYMAPEQARGENWRLDERTDVFALGGILYRVLTGRPPYREQTAEGTRALAAKGEYLPPEQRTRPGQAMPRRLVAICKRALQVDPKDRYQHVSELKRDLDDFIKGFAQLPRRSFKAGEVIIREGEPGDAAFVIFSGECRASHVHHSWVQHLRELGPGQMFGETAVFANAPRSATVTAVTDVVVGVVDHQFLREEMERTSFMSLAIRTVAAGFLDLDAKSSAAEQNSRLKLAVDLTLRHFAFHSTLRADGSRAITWPQWVARLLVETQLDAEAITQGVLRERGFSLEGDQLVLRPG